MCKHAKEQSNDQDSRDWRYSSKKNERALLLLVRSKEVMQGSVELSRFKKMHPRY